MVSGFISSQLQFGFEQITFLLQQIKLYSTFPSKWSPYFESVSLKVCNKNKMLSSVEQKIWNAFD